MSPGNQALWWWWGSGSQQMGYVELQPAHPPASIGQAHPSANVGQARNSAAAPTRFLPSGGSWSGERHRQVNHRVILYGWFICFNRWCRHVVRNCKLCGRLCANLPLVPVSCSPAPPQRAALSARTTPPEMVYAFKSRFPLETKQNLSCVLHRQQPLSAFFTDQHFWEIIT